MDDDGRSMRERMLVGELYIADDPVLSEEHLRAMDLIEQFNRSPASDQQQRRALLEHGGGCGVGGDAGPAGERRRDGIARPCGPAAARLTAASRQPVRALGLRSSGG